MVTGSLAGAVLTFYDLSVWVGLISCITSAVVAWTEFSGTEEARSLQQRCHKLKMAKNVVGRFA